MENFRIVGIICSSERNIFLAFGSFWLPRNWKRYFFSLKYNSYYQRLWFYQNFFSSLEDFSLDFHSQQIHKFFLYTRTVYLLNNAVGSLTKMENIVQRFLGFISIYPDFRTIFVSIRIFDNLVRILFIVNLILLLI